MKFHPVGAEVFHTDGQTYIHTYMKKLIVAFCNSVNVPKNELFASAASR